MANVRLKQEQDGMKKSAFGFIGGLDEERGNLE
jgi:hypothetical protein